MNNILRKIVNRNAFLWILFAFSGLIFSIGLSWKVNSELNFTYSFWYETLEIESHIDRYAPQNRFGKGSFVNTDKRQHVELFQQVVDSINNHGAGLDKISFKTNGGSALLFTEAEVIHLQDVANLIDKLFIVWIIAGLVFLILTIFYIKTKSPTPNFKAKAAAILTLLVSVVLVFITFGFTKVFYYLHTVVFPDNHQWFFYYQESLMSTFMKAPDLFAAMSLNLILVVFLIYIFAYNVFSKTLTKLALNN
ncbi:DUF1461 domain-containing protein [Thalassotalea crassostreae]|uniref:lipoprotein intramolecular transacylase Lit n=1 Tax=Thalassotalea crassostreae TaxID=1763536 RepID=UPI000837CAF6|nr:DUF1461 domain-containing protein [Thalassotalea crassostreae]